MQANVSQSLALFLFLSSLFCSQAFPLRLLQTEESAAAHILEQFDENRNGYLSPFEFTEFYRAVLETASGHSHEHSHEHADEPIVVKSFSHASHDAADGEVHVECYTVDSLFEQADTDRDNLLSEEEIANVSAPMVYNVLNRCRIVEETKCKRASTAVTWVSGIVATIVVSLVSLVILVFLTLNPKQMHDYVLVPMVSFAVGALLGDAIFHLIPEALGAHSHDEDPGAEEPGEKEYLAPMGVVLIAIMIFYLIERQMHHVHLHNHHHEDRHHEEGPKSVEVKEMHKDENQTEAKKDEEKEPTFVVHTSGIENLKGAKPFGYLSLVADALHNFTDGLAIGAAFSSSISSGLATTVAVVLHEIPQELGDFAILVSSGFTKRNAILLNLGTAFTCVLGSFIGLGIGTAVADANKYILSFTAGGFLYVALADMVPELHHEKGRKNTLVQFGFMTLGLFIMLVIGLWLEEFNFC